MIGSSRRGKTAPASRRPTLQFVIWGLRSPKGHIYLLVDDYAADVVLDEWERSDSQLLARKSVEHGWVPAGAALQELLQRRAQKARARRQPIQGEMNP